jgi:type I restriction enzyme S subunit
MIDEPPKGWAECQIGDIAHVIGGGTPDAGDVTNFSASSGVPWLTPADLSDHAEIYVSHGRRFLTKKGYEHSSAKLMPKGAVLFSSRAPIGYVAVAANEICTNQGFRSFVCGNGIDPKYLYFWLKYAKPLAEELASGTTFAEISGTNAAKIPLLLAPFVEQQRIVAKLEKLFGQVDICKQRVAKIPALLKRFRQSVLAAACFGRLTADWREENPRAGDSSALVAELEQAHEAAGGHKQGNAAPPTDEAHDLSEDMLPSSWRMTEMRTAVCPDRPITYGILKPGPDTAGGIPYVRVADFPNDRLDLKGIRRTTRKIEQTFARARLREGDILLSLRGTVGRVCVVPKELQDANITQDTARLSVQPALNAGFLKWFLRATPTQKRMQKAVKGVAVRGINIGDVRAIQLPVPPLPEQQEIVRRVESLFALADRIEARFAEGRKRVDGIAQAVLAKAFRGELVPTEFELAKAVGRSFESAEELLKRIKGNGQVKQKTSSKRSAPSTHL